MRFQEWVPRSWAHLRQYSWSIFKKDLFAGITVGIVALPLAMAFAIASGVSPDKGLFTAIVAGFLISALGGSSLQIGGPTGAFVVIVYGIMQRTGYEGLAVSTLLAGLLLLVFSFCRLGSWIKYIPHSLITGFTSGIAVIIFSSQIRDFFGLSIQSLPGSFLLQWKTYIASMPSMRLATLAVGLGTLGIVCLLRRFAPRIPWGIASIVLVTLIAAAFSLPVDTIYSKFSSLPTSLPKPSLPSFSIPVDRLPEIIRDAFAIAFLGAIESLLSAVIADGMAGTRHKSNCELMAQGVANIGSILFGGIPATGAIARTAMNVKSGAETPVSGMIHAITLLVILSCLSPWVSQIPLASLSAILMVIAWNMSEAKHFIRLLRCPSGDTAILLTAFFLTLFADITVAIMVGMVLASFLFMKKMGAQCKAAPTAGLSAVPPGAEVYEMQGPFFFGSADLLQNLLPQTSRLPKVFILGLHRVPFIDLSGVRALQEFSQQCRKHSTQVFLSGVQDHLRKDLERFGLVKSLGSDHIFTHIDEALAKARDYSTTTC